MTTISAIGEAHHLKDVLIFRQRLSGDDQTFFLQIADSKLTSQYYTCTTDRDKSYEAFAKCKIDPSMVHMFQDARPRLYIGKESFEVSMTHPTSSDDATYFELYLPFWIVDDLDDSHIVFE